MLALRVYTTRLLGRDPRLVLHGGGNTSVKTQLRDLIGDDGRRALRQGLRLGHGRDRARRACRRCGSRRCASCARCDRLSDEDMVQLAARQSARSGGAQPLGRDAAARLPAAQIRRPHPFDRRARADRPARTAKRCAARSMAAGVGFVPYIMPGFGLAKAAAEVFDADPEVEGLILRQARHLHLRRQRARGLRAHDRDGDAGRRAACARQRKALRSAAPSCRKRRRAAEVAPILRGACSLRG